MDASSMLNHALRVAVVDDEETIRRALLRLLVASAYEAEAFDSAVRFLQSLSRRVPDCVILDLQMPEMTGLELQRRLLVEYVHPPAVIVITAYDEPGTRQTCRELGAVDYFCKPVDGSALLASLVRIEGGRSPQRTSA